MAKQDLTVYRGTAYNMTYTHVEAMTGGTVYFTVKSATSDDDATDAQAMPKKTVTVFTLDADGNTDQKAVWSVTDADMYIEPGTYHYDIVYEGSDGESFPPIFEGKFKVLPHPTNRNVGNE